MEHNFNKARWTEEEDDFLRKHFETSTQEELALALNRTDKSVKSRTIKLGLRRTKPIIDGKKYCKDCKEYKLFSQFHHANNTKNTLYSYCKICSSKRGKRNYFLAKERELEQQKKEFYDSLPNIIHCSKCNEDLDKSNFNISRSSRKDLKKNFVRAHLCRKCHALQTRENVLKKERNNEYANPNKAN